MARAARGGWRAERPDQRRGAGFRRAAGEGARRAHRARAQRGRAAAACGEPDAFFRNAARIPAGTAAPGRAHRRSLARAARQERCRNRAPACRQGDIGYLTRRRTMTRIEQAVLASALAGATSAFAAPVVLRASHQFPGGKGDVRDEMVQIIARDAKAAGVDLDVQVYPGASLFKPNEQWNALVNGQLDISSFPLDYASGKERAFGATLMPALVRSHERAARLNDSQFMKDIRAKIEKDGVIVLSDAWLAGAVASKKGCVRTPADIKGVKIRSAGPTFASMWQAAGASIVSVPSNEVYNALQTGVAEATDTSSSSFVSFRIYEQVKCITAPGDNALWFMYEPGLLAKKSFNRLNKEQQGALINGGKKAEDYFNKATKGLDGEMVATFRKHDVEVVTLTPEDYAAWVKIAQESS